MGIPSYFGYLLKNHYNIFKKLSSVNNIDNFYIDANGIIYNSIKKTQHSSVNQKNIFNKESFEDLLIYNTILELKNIINLIKPKKNLIIAFDGPAPLAKVHQQKTRRFKNSYLNNKFNKNYVWDTCAISPGTNFMEKLDLSLSKHFNEGFKKDLQLSKLMLYPSSQPGEGEHKIFSYIRQTINEHKEFTTIIYGLDADLIMLSLTHLPYCKEIYLFRDSNNSNNSNNINNNSNNSNNNTNENDENNFFKINDLAIEIINTLSGSYENQNISQNKNINLINDYIFMCFLVGNDFMPHFPSLNIRLNAIDKLINIYREYFYKNNLNLTFKLDTLEFKDNDKNKKINFKINNKNFKNFIKVLSENEEKYLINLELNRQKFENNFKKNNLIDLNDENIVNNLPIIDRNIEKFINPSEHKWQKRYYCSLFNLNLNINEEELNNEIKKFVNNYLEIILWTFNYYNDDCLNWRIFYKYNYAPLLSDLYNFMPYFDNEINIKIEYNPYPSICSLINIIPPTSYNLLPNNIENYLKTNYNSQDYNINNMKFIYSYSRYFWESHIDDNFIEKIDINVIEKDLLKLC